MNTISFFEGENIGIGIELNEGYDLNRLLELEVSLKAKNSEKRFTFRKSNLSLIVEENEPRIYKCILTNIMTLNNSGEYTMQFKVIDNQLGVRKSELGHVCIHRDVVTHETELVSSDIINYLFRFEINNTVEIIGELAINLLGVSENRRFVIVNKTTGHIIEHNYNCTAVRATYIDEDGNVDSTVYFMKNTSNINNTIVCIFPTNDSYSGSVYVEKLF